MTRLLDKDFATKVGCHYSMASRLRRGERMPSRELLKTIVDEFGLNHEEAFNAFTAGPTEFGKFLRKNVFDPASPETD